MKILLALAATLLPLALATEARAECTLAVNPSSFIPRGQSYSYHLMINDFGPRPPFPTLTVLFFGTKNGVIDTPPAGEAYPGLFGAGDFDLAGFQNPPAGGLTGDYVRFVIVKDQNGNVFCTTNLVQVFLE